jgi:hypothetical protein
MKEFRLTFIGKRAEDCESLKSFSAAAVEAGMNCSTLGEAEMRGACGIIAAAN